MAKETEKRILPDIGSIKTQETYTLPSKGLVYSPEDNIPASVTLRRMTTKEDKIRMRNEDDNKIRRDILQACIVEENVDAGKLKLVDANYLLFKLRVLSLLNDTYKVRCICDNCGQHFIHEVELSKIPIEYMSKDKLKNLNIVLPLSKQEVKLKYPNINNILKMTDSLKAYMEKFPNEDVNEVLYTSASVNYIETVDKQNMLLEELEDWMESLDIVDSRFLMKTIRELDTYYSIGESLQGQCPTCKNKVTHGLPLTNELFTPSN